MKRKKWIILAVLAAIVLAIGAALIWQRNNVTAIVESVSSTPEEIETKLFENDKSIEDAVSSVPEIQIRPVTEEEREQLQSGELTATELAKKIQNIEPEKPASPNQSESTTPQKQQEPQTPDPYVQGLSAIIAEVFVLREEYTIELDKIEAAAKKDYFAIPKADRTASNLASLGSKYISIAATLEKNCDAKMTEIVSRLRALVNEHKRDKSIISMLQYNYAQTKSLKKAWYLSKLKEKGIQ